MLKKKLFVCEWTGTDFNYKVRGIPDLLRLTSKPLDVPDVAKTVAFCGQSLCIGFKRKYNMLDIQSGQYQPLFETGKSDPLCTVLPEDQLLLGRDSMIFNRAYLTC